ncbi:MAG: HEAT repeat domain-containing protein, partial [Fuerstiella sp.]
DARDLPQLAEWLSHDDATVRYWAATGIGNRGDSIVSLSKATDALGVLLQDESENVRIAAARALMDLGHRRRALRTLSQVLDGGTQWARVHAAIVLDELGEAARPVIKAMKRNKVNRDGFVAKGKYAVRVLNKALNDLEGTHNTVP